MIKRLAAAAAILFCPLSLSGALTNNIAVGYSVPLYRVRAKDTKQPYHDTTFLLGGAFNIAYLGFIQNTGLTFRSDLMAGMMFSCDIPSDRAIDNGAILSFNAGIGYSFVRTKKDVLSLCGIAGFSYTNVNSTKSSSNVENEYTITLTSFDVGAGISYIHHFSNSFGIYANVDGKYMYSGFYKSKNESTANINGKDIDDSSKSNYSISGRFAIAPTISLCWSY